MPKIKTRKSASKRLVKITGGGKLIRRKMLAQHLVRRKSRRTTKASGRDQEFKKTQGNKIKKLAPYRKK